MMTHAEARRECLEARERVRAIEMVKPLQQIMDEVKARRVSPTAMAGSGAPAGSAVGRARRVDPELEAELARVRGYKTLPVPSEPAAAPRVIRYWTGNSRFGVLREVVVPEPPKRDRWGGIVR